MQDTHIRPNELSWNQYWDKYYRELNKEVWNHYGSGKVRRIDAGVKTLQFSQQNINTMLKNRR